MSKCKKAKKNKDIFQTLSSAYEKPNLMGGKHRYWGSRIQKCNKNWGSIFKIGMGSKKIPSDHLFTNLHFLKVNDLLEYIQPGPDRYKMIIKSPVGEYWICTMSFHKVIMNIVAGKGTSAKDGLTTLPNFFSFTQS